MLLLALGPWVLGCKPTQRFESVCQIVKLETVETDADGNAELVDLLLEWDPCPGEQYQVVRGSKAFAACMAQYAVGDYVPVHVVHWWDTRGFYIWDVDMVGNCARPIEVGAEGSYERSRECSDNIAFGKANGFRCNQRPFSKLVRVCPWMARD